MRKFLSALVLTAAAGAAQAYPAWQPDVYYTAGTIVSYNGADYMALVNQTDYTGTGWNPLLASLWQPIGNTTPPPGNPNPPSNPQPPANPNPPTTPSPPPSGFLFSPYKDITISMNWNTNVISSAVTGSLQPVLTVMPTNLSALTWGFATGECGNETWAGLSGPAVAAANIQNFVSMGRYYIVSTGGAAGSFTCSTDAGFDTFIQRYNSSSLLGFDFDIEAGAERCADRQPDPAGDRGSAQLSEASIQLHDRDPRWKFAAEPRAHGQHCDECHQGGGAQDLHHQSDDDGLRQHDADELCRRQRPVRHGEIGRSPLQRTCIPSTECPTSRSKSRR